MMLVKFTTIKWTFESFYLNVNLLTLKKGKEVLLLDTETFPFLEFLSPPAFSVPWKQTHKRGDGGQNENAYTGSFIWMLSA